MAEPSTGRIVSELHGPPGTQPTPATAAPPAPVIVHTVVGGVPQVIVNAPGYRSSAQGADGSAGTPGVPRGR